MTFRGNGEPHGQYGACPGRAVQGHGAAYSLHLVGQGDQIRAAMASAPPAPSSRTRTVRAPPARSMRMPTAESSACFALVKGPAARVIRVASQWPGACRRPASAPGPGAMRTGPAPTADPRSASTKMAGAGPGEITELLERAGQPVAYLVHFGAHRRSSPKPSGTWPSTTSLGWRRAAQAMALSQ